MEVSDTLCNLTMIKAQYHDKIDNEGSRKHYFEVQITSEFKEMHFDIPIGSAELFAAELDVLASTIKARVAKERLASVPRLTDESH
jgi:hypothetical protein